MGQIIDIGYYIGYFRFDNDGRLMHSFEPDFECEQLASLMLGKVDAFPDLATYLASMTVIAAIEYRREARKWELYVVAECFAYFHEDGVQQRCLYYTPNIHGDCCLHFSLDSYGKCGHPQTKVDISAANSTIRSQR
jgi:hypothetical protein